MDRQRDYEYTYTVKAQPTNPPGEFTPLSIVKVNKATGEEQVQCSYPVPTARLHFAKKEGNEKKIS